MAGRRFGPYELEELLGRGGMGEVHRAVDTRKSRSVALKLLPSALAGDPDIDARFRREAEVAARLNDPHVIPIHDYGELHGRLFLDMRLVDGVDLAKTLRAEGALPPARAVSILSQVADALDSAHDGGLIHRDVKPSNILLTGARRGSEDFVYLIDFGIAAGTTLGTRLTGTGQTVGTAAYMAPERFAEGRENDPRVDVYALGCVLHEMLTGDTPFDGTSFPNLMYQHLHTPPPRPSASGALAAEFDAVVSTALAKDPEARYPRAGDLAEAARTALATAQRPAPPSAHHPSADPSTDRPSAHHAPPTRTAPPPPTRAAPPMTRQAPEPSSRPRWELAPPPVPQDAVAAAPRDAGPTAPPPPRPSGWRLVSAITVLVLHALWAVMTVTGTAITYSYCGAATSACVGGTVGLLAVAASLGGIATAVLALTRRGRGRRGLLRTSWILLAVAVVVLMITAGFGAAATSS